MGTAVSSGRNNDELVDNLIKFGHIRTKKVEQVFRAVDRADYFLRSYKKHAYKDLAWKRGNLHLSAPCVYSEVMECLSLEPGLSFLNLGSGTGYLSTMAGLILKTHGTNHGIELHQDCLNYAYERLKEFKKSSPAINLYDFCEPVFIQGNCLNVAPGRQYDRVYCGAACPESHEAFIKQFVSVGGILVMPFKDHLLCMHRITENTWIREALFPVSFATLVVPVSTEQTLLHLPESDPLPLQDLCRRKIRDCLRRQVWQEHAELEKKKFIRPKAQKDNHIPSNARPNVVPSFEESYEVLSGDDDDFPRELYFSLNMNSYQLELTTPSLQGVMETDQNGSVEIQSSENDGDETKIESDHRSSNGTESISDISSESDSEMEQNETVVEHEKAVKRGKMDSGIVEDVKSGNDDDSSSSSTDHSDSESMYPSDPIDAMNIDIRPFMNIRNLHNVPDFLTTCNTHFPRRDVMIARYIDTDTFTVYMRNKIHQLPLPYSLKLYINYNRKLYDK